MTGQLAVCDRSDAKTRHELHLRRHREPYERSHGSVGAPLAEQRPFELLVGAIECLVVPVESAARLGCRDEQPEQDGLEQRLVLCRAWAGMRAGEDAGGRLTAELLQRDQRVVTASQALGALFHERSYKRPVLVERRTLAMLVLDECDGHLPTFLELSHEVRECAERERSHGVLKLRGANAHDSGYAPPAANPRSTSVQTALARIGPHSDSSAEPEAEPRWHPGHQ